MSDLSDHLTTAIETALPGAQAVVHDPDGAHLSAVVTYAGFAGKAKLAQHRMVYAALGDAFETTLHALQLTTKVPR